MCVVVLVVAVVVVSGVRKTFGLEKESATNTSRLWLHLQIVTAVGFHSVYVRRTHCYLTYVTALQLLIIVSPLF